MSKRLGGIIGCKNKTSSWHLNGFPDGSTVTLLLLCVCVFSSHLLCWTSSSLDGPAGVTQEEGHTGFLIHLPSAVRALIFLARRIQPFLSLVDRGVDFCVLTIKSFSTCWAKPLHGIYPGSPMMEITLGQQYNVGEKPTVILYTYINHHAEPPNIIKHKTLYYIVKTKPLHL